MTLSDIGPILKAIVAAIPKAVADYQANAPLPPEKALTGAQAAAGARKLQAFLAEIEPVLEAHPGAITAADDILEAIENSGAIWAGDVEEGVNAVPATARTLLSALPGIIWVLAMSEPAATGIQGDHNDPMSPPSLPP